MVVYEGRVVKIKDIFSCGDLRTLLLESGESALEKCVTRLETPKLTRSYSTHKFKLNYDLNPSDSLREYLRGMETSVSSNS